MKINHGLCVVSVLLSVFASAATAGAAAEYYAIFVDGKKIGHAVQTRTASKDIVTTVVKTELTITRMGVSMTIRTSETHVETPTGKPISFESVQDLGAMILKFSGKILPGEKMQITTSQFGQTNTTTVDYPPGTLMSEGLRLLTLKKGFKPGTNYKFKQFVGMFQKIIDCQVKVVGQEKVDLLGRITTLTRLDETSYLTSSGTRSVRHTDRQGKLYKSVQTSMGIETVTVACDKAFALSKNDVVDFLDKATVQSPTAASTITSAKSASYHLTPISKQKMGKLIETDSQKVKSDGKGGYFVTVTKLKAPGGAKLPYKGSDTAATESLKPSRYIDSKDGQVIALARKAVGDTKDAAQAARKIESFVHDYINEKSLAVGYATASEVARSREGDCTEHAVLTAAMCKAMGIPARMVCGYVIVPDLGGRKNVFGGHAWTEAYIGGKWIPLDATRNGVTPGHISLAVSNGDPAGFFDMINTFGTFKISKITVKK